MADVERSKCHPPLAVFQAWLASDVTPTFKKAAVNRTQHELTDLGSREGRLVIAFFADLHLNGCPSESHSYVSRDGSQPLGSSGTAQYMVSGSTITLARSTAPAIAKVAQ